MPHNRGNCKNEFYENVLILFAGYTLSVNSLLKAQASDLGDMFSDPIQNSVIRGKSVLMTFPCIISLGKERLELCTGVRFQNSLCSSEMERNLRS